MAGRSRSEHLWEELVAAGSDVVMVPDACMHKKLIRFSPYTECAGYHGDPWRVSVKMHFV